MQRPSQALGQELEAHLERLDRTRKHVEQLQLEQSMSKVDVDWVYEGLFMNAMSAFERFLEDLFVGLLVHNRGLVSSRSDVSPLVVVRSHERARSLVFGDRDYADWLPYERTVRRAETFFAGGRPFKAVGETERVLLKRCFAIRNAIAHRSRKSKSAFEHVVLEGLILPPRERTPVGFLRSSIRVAPPQTRFENLSIGLAEAARELAR